MSPRGGPLEGGTLLTLHGTNLAHGSNYTCQFDNATGLSVTIDARDGLLSSTRAVSLATHEGNTLRCYSPASLSAQVAAVRISANAQQYVETNVNLTFTFYVSHEVEYIVARSGLLTGWTTVLLHGIGLLQPRTPDARAEEHRRLRRAHVHRVAALAARHDRARDDLPDAQRARVDPRRPPRAVLEGPREATISRL
mgnify:CR=1 FL=1